MKYVVGSIMEFHESGMVGKVKILACDRFPYGGTEGTSTKLQALEEIGGNSCFTPIPKGEVFEVWASDNAGAYAGWSLCPIHRGQEA